MVYGGISNWFDLAQVTTVALHSSVQQPRHAPRKHFLALLPILWLWRSRSSSAVFPEAFGW